MSNTYVAARTDALRTAGIDPIAALNGGYHIAFVVGAVFAAAAGVLGAALLRTGDSTLDGETAQPVGVPANTTPVG
ncbi:MAG: hypothetical protein ACRDRK_19215 [Pseudonocardia sp.]